MATRVGDQGMFYQSDSWLKLHKQRQKNKLFFVFLFAHKTKNQDTSSYSLFRFQQKRKQFVLLFFSFRSENRNTARHFLSFAGESAHQNKGPALQNKATLASMKALAFIVLPAPTSIYSKLKVVMYPIRGLLK